MLRKILLPLLATSLLAPGCGDDGPAIDPTDPALPPAPLAPSALDGRDFVAVRRPVDAATRASRSKRLADAGGRRGKLADDDFYLAVHRRVLSERWFLSAFLEQYFPDQVGNGRAASLGTRVVSFKVQNDKLFMFDVDDRDGGNDVIDTRRLVEAYPLAGEPWLRALAGAADYVIVDPAAGLNRFDLVADVFGGKDAWPEPARFTTELSFADGFEPLADGAFYRQVFTGTADRPIHSGEVESNRYRASGTLGISLRRYREGSHYTPLAMPELEHYFASEPRVDDATGEIGSTAAHYDLYPGMAPIEWLISPELARLDDSDPDYADIDLIGAIRTGVETWNQSLGFQAFTTRVARDDESFARDDLNYIVYDPSDAVGYAYASWRTNPNTGEIRGASIYFGPVFIRRSRFETGTAAVAAGRDRSQRTAVPGLRWNGAGADPLCVRRADDDDIAAASASSLSTAERLEGYLAELITHEVGHNLGLRHNFKGSLAASPTSVMDYLVRDERIAAGGQSLPYDVAAVRYLYGVSDQLPDQAFCTDDGIGVDPECRMSDRGPDPLTDSFRQPWIELRDSFLYQGADEWALYRLDDGEGQPLFEYARQGDYDQAQRGLAILFDGIAAPVDPALIASAPGYGYGADVLLRAILARLDTPGWAIEGTVRHQMELVITNVDGIRSFASRRALVPFFKKRQDVAAYRTLLAARARIATELEDPALDPDQALIGSDLLIAIDAATHPYFQ